MVGWVPFGGGEGAVPYTDSSTDLLPPVMYCTLTQAMFIVFFIILYRVLPVLLGEHPPTHKQIVKYAYIVYVLHYLISIVGVESNSVLA